MSTENSCRCVSEQNTRVQTIRDDVCRDIARYGEPYNPFKAPQEQRGAMAEKDVAAAERGAPGTAAAARPGVVVERRQRGQGTFPEAPGYRAQTYTPPTTLDL